MAKGIATGLLIASLVLLVIYGADAAAAASSPDRVGFLPLSEAVRGGALGGGAVAMSIIGFVIARKEYAPIVPVLLFVNGGLIIAGMLALIAQGALASEDSSGAVRTIGSTMAMGAVLIGLGAWKVAIDRKAVTAKGKEPAQK
ncbi:MAG TPA: hypothetical protein VD736_03100 [Nitrososphaera sp.]|nr:hypothetical protein [Nitrososphaera sp.]